jgi:hypothetical protein
MYALPDRAEALLVSSVDGEPPGTPIPEELLAGIVEGPGLAKFQPR